MCVGTARSLTILADDDIMMAKNREEGNSIVATNCPNFCYHLRQYLRQHFWRNSAECRRDEHNDCLYSHLWSRLSLQPVPSKTDVPKSKILTGFGRFCLPEWRDCKCST